MSNKSIKRNLIKQSKFGVVIDLLLLLFFLAQGELSYAQLPLSAVNLDRIHQKKVRELVHHQSLNGITYFSDLQPSCYNEQDSMTYSIQRCSNVIREVIQKVWNKLKKLKPNDEYNGKMVSFGFFYSKRLNQLFYPEDDFKEIEEGEIYFLNLKLLGGIKNIGVALEVTKVDEVSKTIQFCYLNNGMSEGTQEVKLVGTNEGNTIITQETRYRNRSKFREKKLYPIFHQQAISELQANVKRLIEGN